MEERIDCRSKIEKVSKRERKGERVRQSGKEGEGGRERAHRLPKQCDLSMMRMVCQRVRRNWPKSKGKRDVKRRREGRNEI